MEKYDAQEGNNQDGATALGSTMDSGYIGVDPRTPSNPAIQVWESAAMTPIRVTCRLHIPVWYALVVICGAFFVMQLLSAVIVTSLQTCSAEQDLIEQLEASISHLPHSAD